MKSLGIRVLSVVLALAAMIYGGDWGSVRYRIWRHRDAFGSITVTPVYVIHEKNGKTEYQFAQPQDQVCVRSLFPHFGYSPCWYVKRHQEQRIEI
ncbi:MAG: hypothetical protein ACLP6G_15060 [Terriglobales bacterium]